MRDLRYVQVFTKSNWSAFCVVQLTVFYKLTILHSWQVCNSGLLEFLITRIIKSRTLVGSVSVTWIVGSWKSAGAD